MRESKEVVKDDVQESTEDIDSNGNNGRTSSKLEARRRSLVLQRMENDEESGHVAVRSNDNKFYYCYSDFH